MRFSLLPILFSVALAGCLASTPAPEDRPNLSVKDRIEAALRGQTDIETRYIAVDVADGVVTLSGLVPTAEQRRSAGRTVERIRGVVDVVNNLAIQE